MRTTLVFAILLFVMSSCNKDKEGKFNLDAGIEIYVQDKSGNDLLNPSIQNAYKESEIKIYYLIDGVKKEVYYPNYDYPRNFRIIEAGSKYYMMLSPNGNDSEEYPTTYIQWNESDTDTIKCEFSRTSNSIICTKIWYNGSLAWSDYSNGRIIQIVK